MDGEVLMRLYRTYRQEILLYLYSLCRDPHLAEDLTQETFLKALLALSDRHTNMRAWLYTVARNLYRNAHRRQAREAPLEEALLPQGDSPLTQLLRSERNAALLESLGQLTGAKGEVLRLQYFGGLSQKEIAAVLGLTPANVRVLALRGRRELKRIMEENGYDIS